MPEKNWNAFDPNAGDEAVSNDVDHLIECPVCEQYRHKSWFQPGLRGCWACYHHERLWAAALQEALRDANMVTRKN